LNFGHLLVFEDFFDSLLGQWVKASDFIKVLGFDWSDIVVKGGCNFSGSIGIGSSDRGVEGGTGNSALKERTFEDLGCVESFNGYVH
jgi:hypothetical protein